MSDWGHVDKEEIIITEEGLDEAIHNAYLKGKNDVLDKIRAEIEKKMDEPEYQHEDDDWGVGLAMALDIIDNI